MKVKLLKKVRKAYSVEMYPNRTSNKYIVTPQCISPFTRNCFSRKQDAIDEILRRVKVEYIKHSRRYKEHQEKEKVWYNK